MCRSFPGTHIQVSAEVSMVQSQQYGHSTYQFIITGQHGNATGWHTELKIFNSATLMTILCGDVIML